jgi:hypothetical protein
LARARLVRNTSQSSDQASTTNSLDLLRYQKVAGEPYDLLVNDGLPTQLFDPEIPTELRSKFQVLEGPDIEIPAGGGRIQ